MSFCIKDRYPKPFYLTIKLLIDEKGYNYHKVKVFFHKIYRNLFVKN